MAGSQLLWTVFCLLMTVTHAADFSLTILHTNDIHARFQEINKYNGRCSAEDAAERKCYGGMARLKTMIDKMRKEHPNSLLLDAGDQYQGTLLFYMYGGELSAEFMNLLGYDAMAIGNHEFDRKPSGMLPLVDNVTFPVLSSNIDFRYLPQLAAKVKKSTILTVAGHKIGVIGYTTTETPAISSTGRTIFNDEITSIKEQVKILRNQRVNKIIALGHSGFKKDKEIAEKVPGIDVVVGGHTNTFLYTGNAPANEKPKGAYPTVITQNQDGDDVLVVQDFAYGKYLGFLQVDFDDKGKVKSYNGNPILLDNSVAKDPDVQKALQVYLPKLEALMKDVKGQSLVRLEGDRTVCRVRECSMGNTVADAMVRQYLKFTNSTDWTKAAIAIVNSGGVRSSIAQGGITVADVMNVVPFQNTVDMVELSGKVIRGALEHSASRWVPDGELFGGFLQLSGLKVIYDMRREPGDRVVHVRALCADCAIPEFKPLDNDKIYTVLLQSFLRGGGDGHDLIKENTKSSVIIGEVDNTILLNYVEKNSPITTGLEGRIQFLEDIQICHSTVAAQSSVFLISCLSIILRIIL